MTETLRPGVALLKTYLLPQRRRVLVLAILLLGSIGLQLAVPQVIRFFVDSAESGGTQRTLTLTAVLFFAVALVQRLVALAAVSMGENVGWSATNALRADLTRHCLDLDMPFHKTHTPGVLIERIDGDVSALANFFARFTIRVLGNALLVLGILVVLCRDNWLLGAVLVPYICLTALTLRALQRVAVRQWTRARAVSADHYGYLEERITGTEDIRANGAEQYVLQRLYPLLRDRLYTLRRARMVGNITFLSTNALSVLGYTLGLGLAAYLYRHGLVSIGSAYAIVFYIGMLAVPLENIRTQIQDLQKASASIGRVDALLRLQPQVRETVRAVLPAGALAAEFVSVDFGYDDGVPILHDIGLRLEPGQVLGVLGRTGSGKTTLARLLFRLYDPSGGAIRLGGHDLRDLALADIRSRVGLVTQDVQLFQASVRDNLTFFDPRVEDARILRALDALGLGAWYRALPAGLDSMLEPGGQGLSAGQAQLLAFARVFLRDPGLVLLDEASSRLDPATEQLVNHAVDRLLDGRTALIIAHRLHTVQRADLILILEQGRIVEYGRRAELAADPASRFVRLLRAGLYAAADEEVPV